MTIFVMAYLKCNKNGVRGLSPGSCRVLLQCHHTAYRRYVNIKPYVLCIVSAACLAFETMKQGKYGYSITNCLSNCLNG